MSTPNFPKAKELLDAEFEVWKYLFSKVEEHDKRITALEKKSDE